MEKYWMPVFTFLLGILICLTTVMIFDETQREEEPIVIDQEENQTIILVFPGEL